jgi:hypothetical protein
LTNEPLLCLYHRAQICGLLAKHGDDADVEVADYAMESIDYAQDIIAEENLPVGTNARQAIEDLILDARDTLKRRCQDIQLPEDIMASVWSQPRSRTHDDFDEDDDEEEEEEDEDVDVDLEDDDESDDDDPPTPTSTDLMILDDAPPSPTALQARILQHSSLALPSNYQLSTGSAVATPLFEDFAYELDPQHLPLVGLVLMLLLANPPALRENVLAYAAAQGMRDEDVSEMMARAYGPRRRIGGVVGGEVVLRGGRPRD